jgi:hypothetical protein
MKQKKNKKKNKKKTKKKPQTNKTNHKQDKENKTNKIYRNIFQTALLNISSAAKRVPNKVLSMANGFVCEIVKVQERRKNISITIAK